MTENEAIGIKHRVKNIAQAMMCLQHEFDKFMKEVDDGMVSDTNCDIYGDVRRTSVQVDSSLSASSQCNID